MGLLLSSLIEDVLNRFRKETSLLILGLDNAGKTQILYCMKLGQCITNTVPTLGFNMEEFKYKNVTIKAWDLGGQDRFRKLWHHYFQAVDGVIFVVDSQDRHRFADAKAELHGLLKREELRDVPFLVFANKQDLPHAAEVVELKERLCWDAVKHRDQLHMVACTASENHRVSVGLEWMVNAI
jgi:small GTP-binding protein